MFGRDFSRRAVAAILVLWAGLHALDAQAAGDSWPAPALASLLAAKADIACLGWSRKGACAVLEIQGAGGRGGYYVCFTLMDAVEDKEIFKKAVHIDDVQPASDAPSDVAVAMCGTREGSAFAEECRSRGIERSAVVSLAAFPLSYKGSRVDVRMVAAPSAKTPGASQLEDQGRGAEMLDIDLVASRAGKGAKTFSTLEAVAVSAYGIEGCYPSPYEGRILVVCKLTSPGFEGEPNVMRVFSGCSLDVGFR